MFTVLIDQIEHLDNFSTQSFCVKQIYVTNEIIQFSELIDKNRCEWSFPTIAPVKSMLRQYNTADHILLLYRFRFQSYTLKT